MYVKRCFPLSENVTYIKENSITTYLSFAYWRDYHQHITYRVTFECYQLTGSLSVNKVSELN